MSTGELWRSVTISAVIAVVFGYIGYHVISYALQMVGLFGAGLGVDAESREIYAATHRWVHLFAAACGLAIGWFYHRGQRLFFFLVLVAILGCGGYGIINMYGFTGKNRVTVAAIKDAKRAGAEREYQNARADLQRQVEWAERTAAQEDGREKRRLLAYIDEKRKELSALKVPVPDADTVLSDTHSHSLAALTATDANTWMLLLPLILAVLVFCAESLSFIIVGHMVSGIVALFAAYWAARVRPLQRPEPPPVRPLKSDRDGSSDGHNDMSGAVPPKGADRPAGVMLNRAPDEVSAPNLKVSSETPGVEVSAPPAGRKRDARAIVREFLRANPDMAQSSARTLVPFTGVSKSTVAEVLKELHGRGHASLGPFRSKRDNDHGIRGLRLLKDGGLPALPN